MTSSDSAEVAGRPSPANLGARPQRSLALVAGPAEQSRNWLDRLRFDGDAQMDLVCFSDPIPEVPAGVAVVRASATLRSAASVWFRALRRRYHAVYVVCPDGGRGDALAPLVGLAALLPWARKFVLDEHGQRREIGLRSAASAMLSLMLTPGLLGLARLVTLVGLGLVGGRRPPDQGRGRVAILIPILPDLSHTFVYREALEVKKRHPDYEVLVLEVGDRDVVHHEAAELMKVSEAVPRLSRNRYLAAYLLNWLRRPRAMAGLIRFFQPHTATFGPGARPNDRWWLLRIEYLHHSNYLIMGLMLAECLRKKGISYVHVHGSTYPTLRMLVASRLLGIRFSLSTFVDFDYATPFHLLDVKLEAARFVVTCTDYCRRRLAQRFPETAPKLRVLRHALPRDYPQGKTFRPSDGRSRLVYIGRFVPKKGLDMLIDACVILRERRIGVSCHLYGRGEVQAELERLVAHHGLRTMVRFEGVIPNEAIYSVMNHDDIFVTPSRYMDDGERDGIPVTLLEAMAAGITVVSTPVSGIPELIEHGVNGYLVPQNDPRALADMVEWLVADAQRRKAVSGAARRTVQERFSLEQAGGLLADWISRESRS